MSISNILGTHVLSNAWMNTDGNPATNAPGHAGLSQVDIFTIAANAGSDIVRVPLSLRDAVKNVDGTFQLPMWQIDSVIRPILQDAANRTAAGQPVKVILELGETPAGMANTNFADISAASRAFVDAVYAALPASLDQQIAAWEIGNEPNEVNIGLYQSNPAGFADYVTAVADQLATLEARHGSITVITGAIAYNDVGYMTAMFNRLGNNPNVDGFAIHPYTYAPSQAQVDGSPSSADIRSKRPTDWSTPGSLENNDFQGAIYNLQQLMADRGQGSKGLWITEIGVPSWVGFRNSGPIARDDQGRWTAESLGTLEAWDNPSLKAIAIHATLDYETAAYNDRFNIFDTNPNNNNDGSDGEGAFGMFERTVDGGPIVAKSAAYVFAAFQGNVAPSGPAYTESLPAALDRIRVVIGGDGAESIDLSARGSGAGLTNGWIAAGRGGNDSIAGSAFDDSLFGGDGIDTVRGNAGADRIYGGAGGDTLIGGTGNDDLYGNTGDDRIEAGVGTNRVDGGTGRDTLVLAGSAADYQITGDGKQVRIAGQGETTDAWNTERIQFAGDGTTRTLANGDVNRGNGLGGSQQPGNETLYQDVPAAQWLTGASSSDVFVIGASASGYHAGRTLDGQGIVVWNGAKFDILSGFETLRFSDKDVRADANGRFIVSPGDEVNYPPVGGGGGGENLVLDTAQTQWANGTGSNDVFAYSVSSSGFQSGLTQDGQSIVVWNGAKFDILTGFETLRFSDKDVRAGANGVFNIQGSSPGPGPSENVINDAPAQVQHLTGTTARDVFDISANAGEFQWGRTQDGMGTVVWKGAQFDILHSFEVLRFNDRDIDLTIL